MTTAIANKQTDQIYRISRTYYASIQLRWHVSARLRIFIIEMKREFQVFDAFVFVNSISKS